jgi:hypothetical protein
MTLSALRSLRSHCPLLALGALVFLGSSDAVVAADEAKDVLPAVKGVGIFRLDSRDEALKGEVEGVAVGPLGEIELAARVQDTAALPEPFVLTAAPSADGLLVGTGAEGRVLRVRPDGTVEVLGQAAESQIFAVLARRDGTLLAASSPEGKVYKVGKAGLEPVFDPTDTYIWALAEDAAGRLLVATGGHGRIYRVDAKGEAEVLYEGSDPHVRSLLVEADGDLVFGTAGQGLILRRQEGKGGAPPVLETLYDSSLPEVVALVESRDGEGGIYAALLASEASQIELEKLDPNATEAPVVIGTRATATTGPRSAVVRIDARGQLRTLFELADESVHSLAWHQGSLWVGTGQEGRLYRWADDLLLRETSLKERQLVALAPTADFLWVATSDAAAVRRVGNERAEQGTFTSMVLDAGQVARFGRVRWEGATPAGSRLELAIRTGMSATPDITWTAWRDAELEADGSGALAVGPGRYAQLRATLHRGSKNARGPRIEVLELTYRQDNVAPKIDRLEVLAPGEILVPSGFNPTTTTFEPWSPNKEGIFVSLRSAEDKDTGRLKSLYKKGWRTLRWTATDGNQDTLRYDLSCRPEAAGEGTPWLNMVRDIEDDHHSFDATVLPDGAYRFRLTVRDGLARSADDALTVQRISERVVIDHGLPTRAGVKETGGQIEVELADALNPLLRVELSVDGGEWQLVEAVDGLLDGRREKVRFARPAGARYLLLRVTDAAFNVVTFPAIEP